MKKNFLYIGLGLLALAIILFLLAPGIALPQQFQNPIAQTIAVNGSSLGFLPVVLNQSGVVILTFNSTSAVDEYFTNLSAFTRIASSKVANSIARNTAVGLEGKGVYEVYENSTSGAYPFTGFQGIVTPTYVANTTTVLQAGTYYVIFANNKTSAASISVTSLPISLSKLQSGTSSLGVFLGACALLLIAGLAMIALSFFSKDKQKLQEAQMDE